jgi:hypothetical protein
LLLTIIALSIVLDSPRAQGAERVELACPNGLTVFLEGVGPPRTALLVFLGDRAVGGGATDGRGAYRLPITLRERPGIYPIDVRTRAERADVGRFTCYVDVPFATQPTPTPEIVVTVAPPQEPQAPPSEPGTQTVTPTPTVTPISGTDPAPTAPNGNGGNPTATVTNTPTPTRAVPPGNDNDIVITGITRREPNQALDPRAEFVTIRNAGSGPVDLTDWQLVNTSRTDQLTYTFPEFTLDAGLTLTLYSGAGTDDPEDNSFFWGQAGNIWSSGQVAELRTAEGQRIDSFPVQ